MWFHAKGLLDTTLRFQTFRVSKVYTRKVIFNNLLFFIYFIFMHYQSQKNWCLKFGAVPNIGLDFRDECDSITTLIFGPREQWRHVDEMEHRDAI